MTERLARAGTWVALTIAALLAAWCVLGVAYVPTHDGPQHILMAEVAGQLDAPGRGWAAHFELGAPVTALGFHLPYQLTPVAWGWAHRTSATLLGLILLYGVGFALAVRRFRGRWTIGACVGMALAFQWTIWMGFFPFFAGCALGLCALGVHRTRERGLGASDFATSALLCASAVAHIFPAALFGAVVLALELAASRRRGLLRAFAIGVPALIVLGLTYVLALDTHATHDPLDWPSRAAALTTLPRMFACGPAWRWAAPWIALVVGMVWVARRTGDQDEDRHALPAKVLWGAGAVIALVALVAPLSAFGWQLFAPRFAAIGLPLGVVALLALARGTRTERVVNLVVVLWTVASMADTLAYHRHLEQESRALLARMEDAPEQPGARLALTFAPQLDAPLSREARRVPYALPWKNAAVLLSAARGGVPAGFYGFIPGMHPVIERPDVETRRPPTPGHNYYIALVEAQGAGDAQREAALIAELGAAAAAWDDVLVSGPQRWIDATLERGFSVVAGAPDSGAVVARFEGCAARVRVPPSPTPARVLVQVGWAPLLTPSAGGAFPVPPSPEPTALPVPAAPCGPVRVWVVDDRDGDGRLSGPDRVCRGTRQGAFEFDNVAAGATIDCEWDRP